MPPLSADPTCGVGVAAQGLSLFANFAYNDFQSVAHEMRSHCSQIYSTLRQPVPFAYFHLLNLMVIVNLLLLAYGMAGLAPPPVTIVCFTISCIVFIGLRDLGKGGAASRHCQHRASSPHPRSSSVRLTSSCVPSPPFRPQRPNPTQSLRLWRLAPSAVSMANPFGDDEIDFNFETFLAGSYTNALAILCDSHPPMGAELPMELTNPLDEFQDTSSVRLASTEEVAEERKQRAIKTKATFQKHMSFANAEKLAAEWAAKKEAEEKAAEAARAAELRSKMQAATKVQAMLRGRTTRRVGSPPSSPPEPSAQSAAALETESAASGSGEMDLMFGEPGARGMPVWAGSPALIAAAPSPAAISAPAATDPTLAAAKSVLRL